MTAFPARHIAELFPALLIAAGLALLQALIGGRVLLFALPGYCLVGIAGLLGLAYSSRAKTMADFFCLYGTAIFVAYILVRAVASSDYEAQPDLFSALAALVVYGLTVTTITSSRARRAIFAVLLAFALVHVVIGLIQFSRGDNFMLIPFLQRGGEYGQRASGFYVCPNHLAGLLEVLGIFGISLTLWGRWPVWGKVMAAYASAVCYVGIALTASRGGYLSVMASFFVFAGLSVIVLRAAQPQKWWKFGAIALAALLASGLLATTLIHQSGYLSERAGNMIDTGNMRIGLWRAALRQWELQPVVGTGSGTYRFYGREFREEEMQNDPVDVHNDYLHLLCEYGLVGLAAFLLFFAAHLRKGWRNVNAFMLRAVDARKLGSDRLALNLGALSAIAAYAVHSVVDFNLHVPANAALLAFVFGIIANPGISHEWAATPQRLIFISRVTVPLLGLILLIQCGRFFPGQYFAEKARAALRDEDPAASISFGNRSLKYDRQNPETFLYLGRALIAAANRLENPDDRPDYFGKAIAAYQEAQRLSPLDGTYPLNLAYAYDKIGRFPDAETMYEIARSRDPHSSAVAELYRAHLSSWQKAGSGETEPL